MVISAVFPINAQVESWDPDWDGDNNVGVSDLLGLLSVFGDYDLDNDGIWDSVDDCVGEYDECGVCNGEGISEEYCDCEGTLIDVLGVCGGNCLNDFNNDGICDEFTGPCNGMNEINFLDFTYELIEIGNQCWFKENLRNESYSNGDAIPGNASDAQWSNTTMGAQSIYQNSDFHLNAYGRLYNWHAVNDARGLCPSGWHIPSDEDWIELEIEFGMSETEVYYISLRGVEENIGLNMKATNVEFPYWNGMNTKLFSALPGGRRGIDGSYNSSNTDNFDNAYYWSSTFTTVVGGALARQIFHLETGVNRNVWECKFRFFRSLPQRLRMTQQNYFPKEFQFGLVRIETRSRTKVTKASWASSRTDAEVRTASSASSTASTPTPRWLKSN